MSESACASGSQDLLLYTVDRFKTVIVPGQIDPDGALPLEMKRTKPDS